MHHSQVSSRSRLSNFFSTLSFTFFRRGFRRRLVCFAIILNLLMWPEPGLMLRPILDPGSVLASSVSSTVNAAGSIVSEVGTAAKRPYQVYCAHSDRTDCCASSSTTAVAFPVKHARHTSTGFG